MNITEHRLNIASQLEELSEESLCELEKIITQLKTQQNTIKVLQAFGTFDFDESYDYKKERQKR
ncbi:MAG: hypothetical protein WAX77_16150 [Methylococcaceae bacterium]